MRLLNITKSVIVATVTVLSLSINTYAGAWLRDNHGWWYCNDDRSYTTNNWQQIDGYWYFFDEYGYMKTGWMQSPQSGKWYYLSTDNNTYGRMLTNTTTPDGYWVGADGTLAESGSNTSNNSAASAIQNTGSSGASVASSTSSTQGEVPVYDPIDLGHGILLYPGFNSDRESSGVIALASGRIIKQTALQNYPYEVSLIYYGGVLSGDRRASGKVAAYDANGYELDFTILAVERSQDGQRMTQTWFLPAGTRTIRMK